MTSRSRDSKELSVDLITFERWNDCRGERCNPVSFLPRRRRRHLTKHVPIVAAIAQLHRRFVVLVGGNSDNLYSEAGTPRAFRPPAGGWDAHPGTPATPKNYSEKLS